MYFGMCTMHSDSTTSQHCTSQHCTTGPWQWCHCKENRVIRTKPQTTTTPPFIVKGKNLTVRLSLIRRVPLMLGCPGWLKTLLWFEVGVVFVHV